MPVRRSATVPALFRERNPRHRPFPTSRRRWFAATEC
jgi:hypothetical protein